VEDDGGSIRRPLLSGLAESDLAKLAGLEGSLVLRLVG